MLVSALPSDNLLLNPWFHNSANQETFEHWTPDQYWSLSVPGPKNPSPHSTNGTAAKQGPPQHDGTGVSGIPGILYQVVAADPTKTTLVFQTWIIGVRQDYCVVNVYGSHDNSQTWELVWTPLYQNASTGGFVLRGAQTEIEAGYALYKIEAEARFTDGRQSLGSKLAGLYFAVL